MIKRYVAIFSFITIASLNIYGQQKPKLIVGIVVDQMKMDYLFRFENKFGEDGFKRLMNDGFYSLNAHYNYTPTYTGPGHASIYSGTTPSNHGIIGNDWYNRVIEDEINCVDDSTVNTVGANNGSGEYSPINLLASNISDEIRLSSQKRSKVVGVSIKNRGAILPAGHLPNGAYWYDSETGGFVTSTYYMEELPNWMAKFNKKKLAEKYLNQNWETLLPIDQYFESGDDDTKYEAALGGKDSPTFPYDLKAIKETYNNYGVLAGTPWGNTIVKDAAIAALKGEQLGKDDHMDLLAISFSSTDYIGHQFGPNSVEIEDCYLRLDKDVAELLGTLDSEVGKGNYTVFLTADHAVAENPQYLMDNNVPAGYLQSAPIKFEIGKYLSDKYGEGDWVLDASNDQLFLNRKLIAEKGHSLEEMEEGLASLLMTFPGIKVAYGATEFMENEYLTGIRNKLQNGYHPKRSGDVLGVYEPGWFPSRGYGNTGTTHGSGYTYDTHVPVIIMGPGIQKKVSVAPITIIDIVPTLCLKYKIRLPNSVTGQPIKEIFE